MASDAPRAAAICWIVTDGKAGMESQCLGLAEALGLHPLIKRVTLRAPWRYLTPHFRLGGRAQFASGGDGLAPPWPDLLIATGRHSIAASLLVRRLSQGRTRTVQLQNPVIEPSHFDLVVVPRHDGLSGSNVVQTRGALHRVTREVLKEGGARLASRIAHLPKPHIAVLLGGASASYRMGSAETASLAGRLAQCALAMKGSLLVTPSRRTGDDNLAVLEKTLEGIPRFVWNGNGANPYFGMLALADFIVVTPDSVNMVSEAAATGKPVYVADLPGGSAKFERFHKSLRDEGVTRRFDGALERFRYAAFDDMAMVAEKVRALLRG